MVMIMKSLIVHPCNKSAYKYPLALFAVSMVFTTEAAFAAENFIAKEQAPGAVLILSNSNVEPSIGFSSFTILAADIPAGTFNDPKQLLEIIWNTTYYPQTLGEGVQLCYFRPYSSESNCRTIYPNSSGIMTDFNDQSFGHGAKVTIRHKVLGGTPPYARPAGVDSVTFRYRY